MWAANTFLVNLDSYQGFGRNYYLYFDHDTICHYLVYDLNMSFGGFNQYGFTSTQLKQLAIDWYYTGGTSGGRPLAQRCFDDFPVFRNMVYCALDELLQTTLDTVTFNRRVTELANLVRPYVYADVNKEYTNAIFESNLDNDYTGGGPPGMSLIPGLRSFIAGRAAYIAPRIGTCERIPVAGAVLINEAMPSNRITISDEVGEFDDWFELYNPADTAVDVSYWWVTDDYSEPRKWSFPSGTAHWQICLVATPGAENIWGPLVTEKEDLLPGEIALTTYPNPFNSSLKITVGYSSDEGGSREMVGIKVFDMSGRLVSSLFMPPSRGSGRRISSAIWTPDETVASGNYLISVSMGDMTTTGKVVYLK